MKEKLVKRRKEAEDASLGTRKIGPVAFIDVDFARRRAIGGSTLGAEANRVPSLAVLCGYITSELRAHEFAAQATLVLDIFRSLLGLHIFGENFSEISAAFCEEVKKSLQASPKLLSGGCAGGWFGNQASLSIIGIAHLNPLQRNLNKFLDAGLIGLGNLFASLGPLDPLTKPQPSQSKQQTGNVA